MAAVWETRWANLVRGLFALRESTVLGHLPDLMPVLQVNDPAAVETWLLRRERGWRLTFYLAAAPGFGATIELENPTNSGQLLVVDELLFQLASPAELRARVIATGSGVAGLASLNPQVQMDFRGGAVSPVTARGDNAHGVVAAGPTVWRELVPAASLPSVVRALKVVVPPGSIFQLWCDTANVSLDGMLSYRTRSVDNIELGNQGA